MSARNYLKQGRPPLELLEQAIALLRRTPASTLLTYYLGSVPFWLAVMYFVVDTSGSAFAGERLAASSLLVALLFIHMKCWHAVFGSRLREQLVGERQPWTWGRVGRLVATQAIWQPSGLLIRPMAYLATLPTAWASTFYQNLTLLGDGTLEQGASPARRAWSQTLLWPVQMHWLFAALILFGFFIWLNLSILLGSLPGLLKTFFGWDTMASRSPETWIGNSTFPAVILALGTMLIDPLWKAVFALRCFYGESVKTGADLQVQVKGARP
jgi:hypothetical protein